MSEPAQLEDLSAASLSERVSRIYGVPLEVTSWTVTPLAWAALNPVTGGLYRVRGEARGQSGPASWSAVVKVIRPDADHLDRSGSNYWRREADAYASSLLDAATPRLRAARCGGVEERPDGRLRLWLEEVREPAGYVWNLERYQLAAGHFGEWSGRFLAGAPLPDGSWLSRDHLRASVRAFVAGGAGDLIERAAASSDALVRRAFPPDVAEGVQALIAERERLLGELDALPRVLAHLDAGRPNVFHEAGPDGAPRTIAIDWSFLGPSVLGDELGPMVAGNLLGFRLPAATAASAGESLRAAYLAGLRLAGWSGDPASLELGFAGAASLRFGVVLPFILGLVENPEARSAAEEREGRPIEGLADDLALVGRYLVSLAGRAREMLGWA